MQTFLVDGDPAYTAKILDRQRLGKQRVETIQILNALHDPSKGWQNHPATKMWKGYEPYLVYIYLWEMMEAWKSYGYKNEKCEEHFIKFADIFDQEIEKPPWADREDFSLSHKSNLIRKKPAYYRSIFGYDIPDDLEYIWPV